jgi:hypothetical protein
MKIAITLAAAALTSAGCVSDPTRKAAGEGRLSGDLTSEVQRDIDGIERKPYQSTFQHKTDENIRNTPYENARTDQRLSYFGRGKN